MARVRNHFISVRRRATTSTKPAGYKASALFGAADEKMARMIAALQEPAKTYKKEGKKPSAPRKFSWE
jgi:hypothetical protein